MSNTLSPLIAVLLGLAVGLSACTSAQDTAAPAPDRTASTSSESDIVDLKLLTSPTALNLDDEPGVNGFSCNVYALRRGSQRPVAIESGTLEVLLFDGVYRLREIGDVEPRQTWSFPPDRLAESAYDSAIGVGYGFTFYWDSSPPFEHDDVTIFARYTPPGDAGRPVYSAPVSLSRQRQERERDEARNRGQGEDEDGRDPE